MIGRVHGVLLEPADAAYLVAALELLVQDRSPSPKLADFVRRLRRITEKLALTQENTCVDARKLDAQHDSAHLALYDLVDAAEAAGILGCTQANVGDLARRGRLPRHRAGRRWLYPAAAVVALAEQRAANRG